MFEGERVEKGSFSAGKCSILTSSNVFPEDLSPHIANLLLKVPMRRHLGSEQRLKKRYSSVGEHGVSWSSVSSRDSSLPDNSGSASAESNSGSGSVLSTSESLPGPAGRPAPRSPPHPSWAPHQREPGSLDTPVNAGMRLVDVLDVGWQAHQTSWQAHQNAWPAILVGEETGGWHHAQGRGHPLGYDMPGWMSQSWPGPSGYMGHRETSPGDGGFVHYRRGGSLGGWPDATGGFPEEVCDAGAFVFSGWSFVCVGGRGASINCTLEVQKGILGGPE